MKRMADRTMSEKTSFKLKSHCLSIVVRWGLSPYISMEIKERIELQDPTCDEQNKASADGVNCLRRRDMLLCVVS
jgi:hypothetical protein